MNDPDATLRNPTPEEDDREYAFRSATVYRYVPWNIQSTLPPATRYTWDGKRKRRKA